MKLYKIFVPLFMIIALAGGMLQPLINNSQSIADKVFRLHIIANSDSSEDQDIKLKLRDYILIKTEDMFKGNTLDECIAAAKVKSQELTQECNEYLKSIGCNKTVRISILKEFFKTRVYDDFTLPAGVYNSMKIEIGEGKGHNWWCIIFPSVCLSSCSKTMSEYLNDDEMELIESGYSPKFKIIEIYEKIKNRSLT